VILQQFPDINWLKQQISQGFAHRRGPGNLQLETDGFPSVIIHTKANNVCRPDITGPISLFINLKGNSICTIDGRRMNVTEDNYCISNRQQQYTLQIENGQPAETFNIHIGEHFSEKIMQGLTLSSTALLNDGNQVSTPPLAFYNKLYRKEEHFTCIINRLKLLQGKDSFDKMLFEETLAELMMYLLQQRKNILVDIAKMPPVKTPVKEELYKRITLATDYIQANYSKNIQLDDIAAAACLSKFHFLRLFKQVNKVSPYQYIQDMRIKKASHYLTTTNESIADIAALLGYENSNSFSRIFKQRTGVYPTQYGN